MGNRIIKFRAWDGDDSVSHKDGEYTYVKAEWHPHANKRGYVKRHRLVLESKIGYYLPKNSVVHHLNGDKRDDRLENLEYHPDQKFHAKNHDNGKRNGNSQFVATDPVFNEIKFRLLNKHTGLYEVFTLGKLIKTTFRNSQFKFAGRFTGLKDKNGKEIYEGDILDFHLPITGADGEPDFTEITAKIDFQGGAFWFSGDGYTDCNWHFYNSKDREVIGNIYSNPELLKR